MSIRQQKLRRLTLPLGIAFLVHFLGLLIFLHIHFRTQKVAPAPSPIIAMASLPEEVPMPPVKRLNPDPRPLPPTAPPAQLKVIAGLALADIELPKPEWANPDAGAFAPFDGMDEITQSGGGGLGELPLQTLEQLRDNRHPVFSKKLRCSPKERLALINANGGTPACEDAVVKALDWLQTQQNDDGSWGETFHVHLTSLALLAYLGHCETHESIAYGETVSKAIAYLIELALENEGHMIVSRNLSRYQFGSYACVSHALCTSALAETYLMLEESEAPFALSKELKKALTQAVEYTLSNQNRSGTFWWDGGAWEGAFEPRSQSRMAKLYRHKMAVESFIIRSSWHLQALAVAQQTGIDLPPKYQEQIGHGLRAIEELQDRRPLFDRVTRVAWLEGHLSSWIGAVDGFEPLVFQHFGKCKHASVEKGIAEILDQQYVLGARLFELKLMRAEEVSDLPSEGRRLIILAGNVEQIFVRIFDRRGKLMLDLDRTKFSPRRFDVLKAELINRRNISIMRRKYIIDHLFDACKIRQLEPYGWYINTNACFNRQGRAWRTWNAMMRPQLLETQNEDGSWPADFHHLLFPLTAEETSHHQFELLLSQKEADITVTALYALTLEVYYRYQLK